MGTFIRIDKSDGTMVLVRAEDVIRFERLSQEGEVGGTDCITVRDEVGLGVNRFFVSHQVGINVWAQLERRGCEQEACCVKAPAPESVIYPKDFTALSFDRKQ